MTLISNNLALTKLASQLFEINPQTIWHPQNISHNNSVTTEANSCIMMLFHKPCCLTSSHLQHVRSLYSCNLNLTVARQSINQEPTDTYSFRAFGQSREWMEKPSLRRVSLPTTAKSSPAIASIVLAEEKQQLRFVKVICSFTIGNKCSVTVVETGWEDLPEFSTITALFQGMVKKTGDIQKLRKSYQWLKTKTDIWAHIQALDTYTYLDRMLTFVRASHFDIRAGTYMSSVLYNAQSNHVSFW